MESVSTKQPHTYEPNNEPRQDENVESPFSNLDFNLKKAINDFCNNEASSEQFQSLAENVLEDLQELAAIDKGLSYNGWYESDDSIHTLLEKNQEVLLRLASHISENRANFPPNLVKLAAQYCWETEHALFTFNEPSFNYVFPRRSEPDRHLISAINNTVPYNGEDASFAWRLCLETTRKAVLMTELERNNLLHFFLKDVKRMVVNFDYNTFDCSPRYLYMNDHQRAEALNVFCDFLARHFEKDNLHFSLQKPFLPLDTIMRSLPFLFKNNPNVTSLALYVIDDIEPHIEPLCNLLENSVFIKKIKLYKCGITDKHVARLVSALNKKPNITRVSLNHNKLTLAGVLELMQCKTITSLNLEQNALKKDDFQKIAEALEKNYVISSLKLDHQTWTMNRHGGRLVFTPSPAVQNQINRLLKRNQNFAILSKKMTIAYPSLQLELPHELIQLILALGMQAKNIPREKFNLPAL